MKEFLGGVMGMNKGLVIEDVRNEVMSGCSGVISETQKGNNYVITTMIEQFRNNPQVLMNMLEPAMKEIVQDTIRNEVSDGFRNMQTWFIENLNATSQTETYTSKNNIELWDYADIGKYTELRSSTEFKYHLAVNGLLVQTRNGGSFNVVEGSLDRASDEIKQMCVIDKNRKVKGKDEYYFRPEIAIGYVEKHLETIKKAKSLYNLQSIKDDFVEDINNRVAASTSDKNNIETMNTEHMRKNIELDKDVTGVINSILNNDIGLRNKCYDELKDNNGWSPKDYWNRFNTYKEEFKKENPFSKYDASQINFLVFKCGKAGELLDIVCSKNPTNAKKVLDEYKKEKALRDLFS